MSKSKAIASDLVIAPGHWRSHGLITQAFAKTMIDQHTANIGS